MNISRQDAIEFQQAARHVVAGGNYADRFYPFSSNPVCRFFRVAARAVGGISEGNTAFQISGCALGQPQQRLNIHAPVNAGHKQFFAQPLFQKMKAGAAPSYPAGQDNNGVCLFIGNAVRLGNKTGEAVKPTGPDQEQDRKDQKPQPDSRPQAAWFPPVHTIFPSERLTVYPAVITTRKMDAKGMASR